MPVIKAFNDIKRKPLPKTEGFGGFLDLRKVAAIMVGVGDRAFKSDPTSGIWLGADKFVDAPFSVDLAGNVTAITAVFAQYLSKAGTAQALTGDVQVGGANVKIDGANNRIVIADATTNRGVMGDV